MGIVVRLELFPDLWEWGKHTEPRLQQSQSPARGSGLFWKQHGLGHVLGGHLLPVSPGEPRQGRWVRGFGGV